MNLKKTISLWAVVMIVTAGGAAAQVKKKKPTPSPKSKPVSAAQQIAPPRLSLERLPVDPNVLIGKLPNGLTYYIRSTAASPKRAELYLVNKAGSVVETDAQRGYAHFISHLALAGTRDFHKEALTNYFKQANLRAGADSAAIASYDETTYQLSLRTDTLNLFEKGISLLANWSANISFDDAAIAKEQTDILNEIRLGGRTAKERLQQQTLPTILNNSRYAQRLPLGTEAAVKAANAASLKSFYAEWYRPDLQAIIVVGDFDPQRAEQLIKDNFSSLKNPAAEKPVTPYTVAAAPGTVVKFVTDKELPYSIAEVVVKHPQILIKAPADVLKSMQIRLFNQMLNNRIDEITQISSPQILFGQASYAPFVGKQDAFSSLVIANGNGLEAAVKTIFEETERMRKFGFLSSELERAKQNALAQISNAYSQKDYISPLGLAADYRRNFLTGNAVPGIDYEYNYYINEIGKITLDDMNALAARLITDQNRTILIEAPESDKAKLPTEATLLQWVANAGKTVTPYVDNANISLMNEAPVAGKVVSTQVDSIILVTNVTLSNGMKVILKPTKFQNNQILINGYSFGGTSLVPDQDFTSANLSSGVVTNSGVAGFNQTQLEKILRGKSLSISPYIGDITQGVSGYAAPADFETAMQLLHLYFTQPRKDAAVWNNSIAQTKALLVTRATDAYNIYQDTVTAVLSNYNLRGMTVTPALLNAASLDKAYSFYKDRFADASNFTFTFTGAFEVADIIPFLETYLGSLPSINKKETFKNLAIRPIAGQVTKTVYKGAGTESIVQLVYSGSYDYSEANNIQMDALEEILNLKLAIRFDEKSGMSNQGARVSYVKIPESRYKITISFSCAPADVDKLVGSVIEELNKLKQNGADQKEIRTFVLNEAKSTQSQLRQNAFWGGSLSAASQNQDNPDRILNHTQNLEQITIPTTKETANKYLSGNNLIKLILMPEKK
jgi:zinc protease